MTHCRLATEMCRARCADGSATMTTEASRTIINWATAMTARAQYRRGSGWRSSCPWEGAISSIVIGFLRTTGMRNDWYADALLTAWFPTDRQKRGVGDRNSIESERVFRLRATIRNGSSACQAGPVIVPGHQEGRG